MKLQAAFASTSADQRVPLLFQSTARWCIAMAVGFTAAIGACTTSPSDDRSGSSLDDAGPISSLLLPDADPSDVITSDVHSWGSGTPKPLDVACDADPCYVAVGGNGGRHLCGLLRDGTVRCWGRDTITSPTVLGDGGVVLGDSALGRGVPVSILEGSAPAPVVGLSEVTQISVGPNLGTCARTSDGSVYCWGRNEYGQLGQPRTDVRLTVPTRVDGIPPVDEVQLGYQTGCAVGSSDRTLYCWGTLATGMDALGADAGNTGTLCPQIASTFRPPVKSLFIGTASGADTVVVLLDGNILASVGSHPTGETSLPTSSLTGPAEMPDVMRTWTFAYIAGDGVPRQWHPIDATIYVPSGAQLVDVKISGANAIQQGGALLATGRLFRWGPNAAGALGIHPHALPKAQYPVEVPLLEDRVVSFATTVGSTCASLVNGKVKCWGSNSFGELGRGTVDIAPHPEAEMIQ